MVKVSETYSGSYLAAAELPLGQRRRAMIFSATGQEIGQGDRRGAKIVLSLTSPKGVRWPKDVVVNKTNARQLGAAYGDEPDGWIGKSVEIRTEYVTFQGRTVPGIKTMPAPESAALSPSASSVSGNGANAERAVSAASLDDDIAF